MTNTIWQLPTARFSGEPVNLNTATAIPSPTALSTQAQGDPLTVQSVNTTTQSSRSNSLIGITRLVSPLGDQDFSNPIPGPTKNFIQIDKSLDNLNVIENAGLSQQRPELIAVFTLNPAFEDGTTRPGPVGDMLDIQISARQLKAENIMRLIAELKANPTTEKIISDIEARIAQNETAVQKETAFLQGMVGVLNGLAQILSPKLGSAQFAQILNAEGITSELSDTDPIRRFMIDKLGFSAKGYGVFSNTKILQQLIDDLRVNVTSFSPALLNTADPRRAVDIDPFSILKYEDSTAQSTAPFSLRNIASTSSNDIAGLLNFNSYKTFLDQVSVVGNNLERVKILIYSLSKEFRMSSGLSISRIRSIIHNNFGVSVIEGPEIFDQIIGEPGQSIFESPAGNAASLASLTRIELDTGRVVFPFEDVTLKQSTNAIEGLSGRRFYVDSILDGGIKYDTTPINNFSNALESSVGAISAIIESTFDINVANSKDLGLNADSVCARFFEQVSDSIASLQSEPLQDRDFFTVALLSYANSDPVIKFMLTLYIAKLGIDIAYGERSETGIIFREMINATDLNAGTPYSAVSNGGPPDGGLETIALKFRLGEIGGIGQVDFVRLSQIRNQGSNSGSTNLTLDTFAFIIAERLFQNLRQTGASLPGRIRQTVTDEYIFERLSGANVSNPDFLLRRIADLINDLDARARSAIPGQNVTYFSTQNPGLTKMNRLGAHTIIWSVVEIFTSFFAHVDIAQFDGQTSVGTTAQARRVSISRRNPEKLRAVKRAIDISRAEGTGNMPLQRTPESALTADELQYSYSIAGDFSDLFSSFQEEDAQISTILRIFRAISKAVRDRTDDAVNFFSTNGPNAALLQEVLSAVDGNDKLSALDFVQVALARHAIDEQTIARQQAADSARAALEDITAESTLTPFVDDSVILPGAKQAMFSMLRSPQYRFPRGSNARILTLGLPAGFTEALRRRFSNYVIGQDFSEFRRRAGLQQDLIRVNVYMRDMLFEHIVFKPKTFIFDTKRFVSQQDFLQVSSEFDDFRQLIENVITTRQLTSDGSRFETTRLSSIFNERLYRDVLNESEVASMVYNHVQSYLLNVYLKLLTGVDMSENSFFINENVSKTIIDPVTRRQFEDLIISHVSGFLRRRLTLDELRNSSTQVRTLLTRIENDKETIGSITSLRNVLSEESASAGVEISQDISTFMRMFTPSSIIFGSGARRQRATSPKLFERIFHIMVDADDYEIDIDETSSTKLGARQYSSTLLQNILTSNENAGIEQQNSVTIDKYVRQSLGELSLRQFFFTITQLPDLNKLQINPVSQAPRNSSQAKDSESSKLVPLVMVVDENTASPQKFYTMTAADFVMTTEEPASIDPFRAGQVINDPDEPIEDWSNLV